MQLDLFNPTPPRPPKGGAFVRAGGLDIPVEFAPNRRAKRYILRLSPERTVRVTVPGRGTKREALEFARSQSEWIETQLNKPRPQPKRETWTEGREILFRGQMTRIETEFAPKGRRIRVGDTSFILVGRTDDLKPYIERHLWNVAKIELPSRTRDIAADLDLEIGRVTVRNQRTRWGSCSAGKNISLNWRLIRTPEFVRDYVIVHELMHTKEMNHSKRFWKAVEIACPEYRVAEGWLKKNGGLLR